MDNQEIIELINENEQLCNRVYFLENWLLIFQKKGVLKKFLENNQISTVAIYAYGKYGKILADYLYSEGINVKYAIDQKYQEVDNILIYTLDQHLPAVDLVIISTLGISVAELRDNISYLNCPIIELNELLKVLSDLD